MPIFWLSTGVTAVEYICSFGWKSLNVWRARKIHLPFAAYEALLRRHVRVTQQVSLACLVFDFGRELLMFSSAD